MATKNEAKNNYYEQRDNKALDKIREILDELPDYVRKFADNKLGRNKSKLTVKGYVIDIRLFLRFLVEKKYFEGVDSVKDITPEMLTTLSVMDFDSYLTYLLSYKRKSEDGTVISVTNKEAGQYRKFSAVRSMYTFMFKAGIIEKDISKILEMPKVPKKAIVYIDVQGISELFDVVNSGEGLSKRQQAYNESFRKRDIAIVSMLLGTGIRESELIGLDFGDIDRRNRMIRVVRKGNKEARIKLPDSSFDSLFDYIDNNRSNIIAAPGSENAVFLSSQKKRLSARALQEIVKKYVNAAQLYNASSISVHKLRSTYATTLMRETGNLLMVGRNLGHEQIQTTLRYAAEDENNSEKAAQKIDGVLQKAKSGN